MSIVGKHKVGGLVGENSGGLTRCYATGVVTCKGCSSIGVWWV